MNNKHLMLFVGEQWLGSNARSVAMGFRKVGWIIDIIDPMCFVPKTSTFVSRIARRIQMPWYQSNFNQAIIDLTDQLLPSVLFVYKGTNIHPKTLKQIRSKGILLAMYYPDLSTSTHGKGIPTCIPEYDVVYTAKSFGLQDMKPLGVKQSQLVLHACDSDIHRPLNSSLLPQEMQCDVAFVGAWSPHKEKVLAGLVERITDLKLKIWGSRWKSTTTSSLKSHLMYQPLFGDYYPAAIQSASINLGLLSEQRYGSSSGDLTTARTFEIPGCRSFMLHERTDEVLTCFIEGKEIECFSDIEELAEKVRHYLNHQTERLAIAEAGYKRCLKEHLHEHRAQAMTQHLKELAH